MILVNAGAQLRAYQYYVTVCLSVVGGFENPQSSWSSGLFVWVLPCRPACGMDFIGTQGRNGWAGSFRLIWIRDRLSQSGNSDIHNEGLFLSSISIISYWLVFMHYSDIRVSNRKYRYVELHIHRLFKRGSLVQSIVFTNSTIND